jgi:hypothetical protein
VSDLDVAVVGGAAGALVLAHRAGPIMLVVAGQDVGDGA